MVPQKISKPDPSVAMGMVQPSENCEKEIQSCTECLQVSGHFSVCMSFISVCALLVVCQGASPIEYDMKCDNQELHLPTGIEPVQDIATLVQSQATSDKLRQP